MASLKTAIVWQSESKRRPLYGAGEFIDGVVSTRIVDPLPTGTNIIGSVNVASMPNVSSFYAQTDTYTAAANGTTVNRTTDPVTMFCLQVKTTGSVTAWEVRLEGSLDGLNWQEIVRHTETAPGNGMAVFEAFVPVLYFRTRCVSISLGAGTNVIALCVGVR